jgi:hypothetical protein
MIRVPGNQQNAGRYPYWSSSTDSTAKPREPRFRLALARRSDLLKRGLGGKWRHWTTQRCSHLTFATNAGWRTAFNYISGTDSAFRQTITSLYAARMPSEMSSMACNVTINPE